jgi:DNA-binding winged helix-turn-helix (wHTH) protein
MEHDLVARGNWASPETAFARPTVEVLTFRNFKIVPASRTLILGERSVELGSRAFDLLLALARARGRLVKKCDLVSCVWPSTFVEDSNLRVQIAGLRKALGRDKDVIKTIPGRGYMLTLEFDVDARHVEECQRQGAMMPQGSRAGMRPFFTK